MSNKHVEEVEFFLEVTGSPDALLEELTGHMHRKITEATGLEATEVPSPTVLYDATVTLLESGTGEGSGDSIEDAIADAAKGRTHSDEVIIKANVAYEIPYRIVEFTEKSLSQDTLAEKIQARIEGLRDTHDARLSNTLESTRYHAVPASKRYQEGGIPDTVRSKDRAGKPGESTESIGEAYENMRSNPRKQKSVVLYAHYQARVYQPTENVGADVLAPGAGTGSQRGEAPSATTAGATASGAAGASDKGSGRSSPPPRRDPPRRDRGSRRSHRSAGGPAGELAPYTPPATYLA